MIFYEPKQIMTISVRGVLRFSYKLTILKKYTIQNSLLLCYTYLEFDFN